VPVAASPCCRRDTSRKGSDLPNVSTLRRLAPANVMVSVSRALVTSSVTSVTVDLWLQPVASGRVSFLAITASLSTNSSSPSLPHLSTGTVSGFSPLSRSTTLSRSRVIFSKL